MENKELETWLQETKAKNLSKEDLKEVTSSLDTHFYLEIKRKLGVGGTLYEHLFNQWQKETEFSPKRGDRVLVWDDSESKAEERIFLVEVKGCTAPNLVVHSEYENEFKNNEWFKVNEFKHMKPLPTEQPTETDFKRKVIDLVEKRIDILSSLIPTNIQFELYATAHKNKESKEELSELLNQIKQLC